MVWWAYSSRKISLTASRVDGSHPSLSNSFFFNRLVKKKRKSTKVSRNEERRKKAGAASGMRKTGRRIRKKSRVTRNPGDSCVSRVPQLERR